MGHLLIEFNNWMREQDQSTPLGDRLRRSELKRELSPVKKMWMLSRNKEKQLWVEEGDQSTNFSTVWQIVGECSMQSTVSK